MLHSGKKIKKKANGVKSSPSVSTALGEAFPECTIFDTRGRRLSRGRISRRLFPECYTRGRLPRVQLGLPRVQLALGEASSSCSDSTFDAISCRMAFVNSKNRMALCPRREKTIRPPGTYLLSSHVQDPCEVIVKLPSIGLDDCGTSSMPHRLVPVVKRDSVPHQVFGCLLMLYFPVG